MNKKCLTVDPATAFSAINWLSVLAAVIAAFVLDMFIGPGRYGSRISGRIAGGTGPGLLLHLA